MEESDHFEDPIPHFQWTPSDPNVLIPVPGQESPGDDLNGARSTRNSSTRDQYLLPNLKGKSLQEVEGEAMRIKLGSFFTSFNDFQRCLDSWSVLNGRVAAKYKTRRNKWVRVCRFSCLGTISSPSQPGESIDTDDLVARPDFQDRNEMPEEHQEDFLLHGSDTDIEEAIMQPDSERNFREVPRIESVPVLFELQSVVGEDILSQENVLPLHAHESGPALPVTANSPLRQPFGPLCVNTLSHFPGRLQMDILDDHVGQHVEKENYAPSARQVQGQEPQQGKQFPQAPTMARPQAGVRRSIVRHTRVWIPDSFAPVPGAPTRQRKRRVPQTGACGQLARLLPPVPDDCEQQYQNCPFRVRCSRLVDTGQFKITVCDLTHTCPRYKHKWQGPSQKARWLGETLAPRIVRNVKVPSRELQAGFQMDYKKTANLQQLWRAKDLVLDWWAGGQRRSFHQIPSLLDRVKEVDPTAVVEWETQPSSLIFKRAFICPSATRTALNYYQPVISLDACHTKNRKYPTQLFVASVLDGNSRVLILCYALAPVENENNWTWFLRLLQRSMYGIDSPSVPFVSDRQKGLINAVISVFPGKVHAHCSQHLRANVKKGYGQAAGEFFLQCVYASNKKHFDKILLRMMKSLAKGSAAVEYIQKIPPKNYARHAFPLPRFGKITSNPCEQANAGLLLIREFAPFRLMVELWLYIQKRFWLRHATALASVETFTKQARERFFENLRTHQQWNVADDGHDQAKVQITDLSEEYLVSLLPKPSCTCQELQEMCWPCEHIMAWDNRDGRDFTRHFHSCWTVASLIKLYEDRVPCFLSNDVDVTDICFPPEPAIKKGRHRVVRIESGAGRGSLRSGILENLGEDEFIDSNGNLFFRYPIADDPGQLEALPIEQSPVPNNQTQRRNGRSNPGGGQRKCSQCGNTGHNKRSTLCPSRPAPLEQTESETQSENETQHRGDQSELAATSQLVQSSAPQPELYMASQYRSSEDEVSHGDEENSEDITVWANSDSYTPEELERWISFAST